MYEDRFSNWVKWENRDALDGINYPGIYIASITQDNIERSQFSWIPDIIYIGMTNSVIGLKGRLKQFDNNIIVGVASHEKNLHDSQTLPEIHASC